MGKEPTYTGPCGKILRSIEDVYDYLNITQLNIDISTFTFDPEIDIFNEYSVLQSRLRTVSRLHSSLIEFISV